MPHRLVGLLLLLAALSCARTATADAADAAQETSPAPPDPRQTEAQACFQRGIELSRAGDDWAARDSFLRSLALWPRVSSFFNLALVELKLGHGRDALRALAEFEQRAEAGDHDPFLAAAGSLRARALGLTGALVLTLSPELVELRVDDEPFERARGVQHTLRLDAGPHRVEARASGHVSRTLALTLARGQTLLHTLSLEKEPVLALPLTTPGRKDQPAWYRRRATWWWTGGAALLAGSVTTVVLLARRDRTESEPYGGSTGAVF